MASVREPIVSWDSTMTVSKWKLGTQAWPMPEEHQGLTLEASHFEEYLDVLTKTMRETRSHAEREMLMNSAVSGAFRLSHSQRVLRDVLERIDAQMTKLEGHLAEDKHNLALRRAYLEDQQVQNREQYERKRQENSQQYQTEIEETTHHFTKLMEAEREEAARLSSDNAELSQQQERLEREVNAKRREETPMVEEAVARLEEMQGQVAAGTFKVSVLTCLRVTVLSTAPLTSPSAQRPTSAMSSVKCSRFWAKSTLLPWSRPTTPMPTFAKSGPPLNPASSFTSLLSLSTLGVFPSCIRNKITCAGSLITAVFT